MKTELIRWLASCETDTTGALRRFSNNEALYIMYLKSFPTEPTMPLLAKAMEEKRWDEAFTYGHALKGLAGNLGFIPLYHATAELVLLLRDGLFNELDTVYNEIRMYYDQIVLAIQKGLEAIQ